MSNIDLQFQSGPCKLCGATNYPLSMGGPDICCACDTGYTTSPAGVKALNERIQTLTQENKDLKAILEETRKLYDKVVAQAFKYAQAIREHRSQRLDDRCWLDDQDLYRVLGDGNLGDNSTPPMEEMLKNCKRFLEQRCNPGNWPSYQELERRIALMKEDLRVTNGSAHYHILRCRDLEKKINELESDKAALKEVLLDLQEKGFIKAYPPFTK